MNNNDLKKYCDHAIEKGFTHAKPVDPASVITAPWVRLKCQFGCPGYGLSYSCPPNTPTPEETRKVLDNYEYAILFHLEAPKAPARREQASRLMEALVGLEGQVFKDGYYKALVFLAGPCGACKECAKIKNEPCRFGHRARPSMESCGIDVFRTARNNGFPIQTLTEKSETQNKYCLLLVE
jgi:predicted metal-binding protein